MTVVALWFVLVFPWHGSEVHGSLEMKASQLSTVVGDGSAFSLTGSLFREASLFYLSEPSALPHTLFSPPCQTLEKVV